MFRKQAKVDQPATTLPPGPPRWVVPAVCPNCLARVDQAMAGYEDNPHCEFCRQPLPVQPFLSAPAPVTTGVPPEPAPAQTAVAAPRFAPDGSQVFDVVYVGGTPSQNKIQVIKAVRTLTGMDLKSAMKLVESPPRTVVAGASTADASKAATMLQQAGAVVEMR